MITVVVGDLTFRFDSAWTVAKYDEMSYYRNRFQRICPGTKAVDIVAVESRSRAFLVEVKDYRRHPRTKPGGLAEEVAEKVRNSLAGLAAAVFRANDPDERRVADEFLRSRDVRVVLHLEQPRTPSKLFPRAFDPAKVEQKLKQLLHAVDPHPRVVEIRTMRDLPWTVE